MRTNMIYNAGKAAITFFLLSGCLALVSCSNDQPSAGDEKQTGQKPVAESGKQTDVTSPAAMTATTKNGLYHVTLQSDQQPLPLNKIHSWTARVSTSEGRHIDDAIVMVFGGMPEHKHGFPSKPRVTAKLGGGSYRIDGVKFNMPGRWEMWINVRAGSGDDKAIFSFDVP